MFMFMFCFCFCFDLILYSAFDTEHNTNKQPIKQTNNNMLYSSSPVELRKTTFSFFFLGVSDD